MAVGPQISVLAPRFSRILSVCVVAICVVTAISLVQFGRAEPLVRAIPAIGLVAFGAYAVLWMPRVGITPAGLEVVNPLRTYRVAWPAVTDITAHWTLTVTTDRGRFSAWAAPAPGPWSSIGKLRRDALGRPSLDSKSREGAAEGAVAAVAPLVMNQWASYRDERPARDDDLSVRWHVATIAVLGVLLVLTVAGIVWQ